MMVKNRIYSLKYQRSATLGCKDIGIKNQSLWQILNSFTWTWLNSLEGSSFPTLGLGLGDNSVSSSVGLNAAREILPTLTSSFYTIEIFRMQDNCRLKIVTLIRLKDRHAYDLNLLMVEMNFLQKMSKFEIPMKGTDYTFKTPIFLIFISLQFDFV